MTKLEVKMTFKSYEELNDYINSDKFKHLINDRPVMMIESYQELDGTCRLENVYLC